MQRWRACGGRNSPVAAISRRSRAESPRRRVVQGRRFSRIGTEGRGGRVASGRLEHGVWVIGEGCRARIGSLATVDWERWLNVERCRRLRRSEWEVRR